MPEYMLSQASSFTIRISKIKEGDNRVVAL